MTSNTYNEKESHGRIERGHAIPTGKRKITSILTPVPPMAVHCIEREAANHDHEDPEPLDDEQVFDVDTENATYLDSLQLGVQQTQRKSSDGVPFSREAYFLTVYEAVEKYWPNGEGTPGAAQDALEKLRSTPYLKHCLKPHLDELEKALVEESPVALSSHSDPFGLPAGLLENWSEEQRTIVWNLQQQLASEHQQRVLAQQQLASEHQQRVLARQQLVLAQQQLAILSILQRVEKETVKVQTQLLALSGLSQAEGTVTETVESRSKTQRQDSTSTVTRRGFPVAEYQSLYDSVLANSMDIQGIFSNLDQLPRDQDTRTAHLKKLSKCLNDHIEKSTILLIQKDTTDYQNKVQAGLLKLQASMAFELGETPDKATAQDSDHTSYTPGPLVHEKDGTQPFLNLVFHGVGRCCQHSKSVPSTPSKSSVRSEVPIPSTVKRRKRIIDFLFQKEGRWEAVIFDDTLSVPVEVKPGCRSAQGPQVLLDEARDQCLSHLAKSVFIGFNFANYGVPCHATGIVANMAAIQVFQLRFESVGTPEVKLQLYHSARSPLMTIQNFERWVMPLAQNKKRQEEFNKLKYDLYGSDGTMGLEEEIPKGLIILFNLMQQRSQKLFGLGLSPTSSILGEQLGFGATSIVFARAGAGSSVIKLSRYGSKADIEHERQILKELQQQVNKHLPSVVPLIETLQINLGDVLTSLPAIELCPAGRLPASLFLASDLPMSKSLDIVLTGVMSALAHIHHQQICHCDVAPKNIVVVGKPENERAVLIDFSISKKLQTKCKTFFGTPNYVHGEIYLNFLCNQRGFCLKPYHDWAGLGFTMVYFANHCMCPWNVGKYPKALAHPKMDDVEALKSVMNRRRNVAKTVIAKSTMSDNLKEKIKKLLDRDLRSKAYKVPRIRSTPVVTSTPALHSGH